MRSFKQGKTNHGTGLNTLTKARFKVLIITKPISIDANLCCNYSKLAQVQGSNAIKSIYEYECEHYFSRSEIRPEKIQASTAFEPMISAYDLICSQSFTHHFTGLLRTK